MNVKGSEVNEMFQKDILILRDLAKQYLEICQSPEQAVRRNLWRRHNGLQAVLPPIYVRAFAWQEMPDRRCVCQDNFFQGYEDFFRQMLFRATLADDFIFEPWVTVLADYDCTGWGIEGQRHRPEEKEGSFKIDYPLKTLEDIGRLRVPAHRINEEGTRIKVQRLQEAIGDIITINVDRGTAYRMWDGDLSTHLGFLRGIENAMLDMMDNPQGLHRLMRFLRDGVLAVHDQAEAAGDWNLGANENQAMPYTLELPVPAANQNGVSRKNLWGFMASQEFTLVSPDLWNEFLLEYQIPILEKFGLAAYGCCEDLTRKITGLKKIKNLRRIAVSPFADVGRCAEQIGDGYVLSYRPSPADMVSYGFDEERIRKIIRRDLEACKGCRVDITLKDVETVQSDPERVKRWVRLVRNIIESVWVT